jgi:acetyl esterase/lipase
VKVTPDMIDPELRRRGLAYRRLMHDQSQTGLRRQHRFTSALQPLMARNRPRDLSVNEEWVSRPDGSRLRLMVYAPLERQTGVAGLLWLHGGGYALGSPDADVAGYREFIAATDCVVVAPDYRLSPEAPYPAAFDDCYLALLWLRDNAERLGVRPDQLAVGGESAGGGLTAAVTLAARDRGEVAVAFQMPIYPMIDDRPPAEENDAPVWDTTTNRSAWGLYLGPLDGTDDVPVYAAPARATDYSGLPPTMTYVGDIEPFHAETLTYVDNLRAAGVPVDLEVLHGAWHGFDRVAPGARISHRAHQFRLRWFRNAVATHTAKQP